MGVAAWGVREVEPLVMEGDEAGSARLGGLARTAVGGRPTRTIDRC